MRLMEMCPLQTNGRHAVMPTQESKGWAGMLPRARGLLSNTNSKRRRLGSCDAPAHTATMCDAAIIAAAVTEPGLTCDTLHAIGRLLEQAGACANPTPTLTTGQLMLAAADREA